MAVRNSNEQAKYNDIGLLYLVSRAEPGAFSHRIRLQKLVLLAQLEYAYPFSYSYRSYYYGPYSFDLRSDANRLIARGFLREEEVASPMDGEPIYRYWITEEGRSLVERYKFDDLKKLDELWTRYGKLSNDAIIAKAKALSGIQSNGMR